MTDSNSKVPEVTLVFWIIKIAATTLGETAGDTVTMTLDWGYLAGTALFLAALVLLVGLQIAAKRFHPFLYWATIIASTTFGTTMADFADRSLGVGYTGGSSILLICLLATLGLWYQTLGSISVDTVDTPRAEVCLLGRHHVFANAGNGAWRLDRGSDRPRLRRRRDGIRRRVGISRGGISPYAYIAGHVVLDGVHCDPAARGDRWRLARQTPRPGGPGVEPAVGLGDHCSFHSRMSVPAAAARRFAPRRGQSTNIK